MIDVLKIRYFFAAGVESPKKSEVPSLKELHKISLPPGAMCDSLAWHPTKHTLAYGANDAYIWGLGV